MFKVNKRSNRHRSGIFIANFEYIWHIVLVSYFLLTLRMEMTDGILYCLNLNLSVHFKVEARSLITFKTKLYVSSVSSDYQYCWKELHQGLN